MLFHQKSLICLHFNDALARDGKHSFPLIRVPCDLERQSIFRSIFFLYWMINYTESFITASKSLKLLDELINFLPRSFFLLHCPDLMKEANAPHSPAAQKNFFHLAVQTFNIFESIKKKIRDFLLRNGLIRECACDKLPVKSFHCVWSWMKCTVVQWIVIKSSR